MSLIPTLFNFLKACRIEALKEKRRQELQKNSIIAEYKVISDEKIEPKKLL